MSSRIVRVIALFLLPWISVSCASTKHDVPKKTALAAEAAAFLEAYTQRYFTLNAASSEANWLASTEVTEAHTQASIAADQALSEFKGSVEIIEQVRRLLARKSVLSELQQRQLEAVYQAAAQSPGTIPDVVKARVIASARQSAALDGFVFKMKQRDGSERTVTPNDIDDFLRDSTDLEERRRAWDAAKSIGPALKDGLVELRGLRNRVAEEMGQEGYFSLEVSDYDLRTPEMMAMLEGFLDELMPLYRELHCYAKRHLAARFGQPVPGKIPAHWLGNRWGQEWPGLAAGVSVDEQFKDWKKEQIVAGAEAFYVSMGFPSLPESFWSKSDLYELPAGSARMKNTHASAWHVDLDRDVRSLMSVRPDFEWFLTAHHELGHIYYYLSYTRPEVPLMLRRGANRAFHEGIGELISLAAGHATYLRDIGVLPESQEVDEIQWLLDDAMNSVVFMPWSAGVMSHYERDLYDGRLPADQFNARWWQYVAEYQGIEPPAPRGEEFCDAATKTHINDDAAEYYDYALATILKFQLNDYIARNILKCSPRETNYHNNKEVGAFLRRILEKGGTEDWRQVLRDAVGQDFSAKPMLRYYAPLMAWLKTENAGAETGW